MNLDPLSEVPISEALHEAEVDATQIKEEIAKGATQTREEFLAILRNEPSWSKKVAACMTAEDFLLMFQEAGIPDDKWMLTRWYRENNLQSVTTAVVHSKRWESWEAFVVFVARSDLSRKAFSSLMGSEAPLATKLAACENAQDFVVLFRELGIPEKDWMSASVMHKKHRNPYLKILHLKRWNSWHEFVLFLVGTDRRSKMHISLLRSKAAWSVKVAACTESHDFLTLFQEAGIPDNTWMNTTWMFENQNRLYYAILKSNRWKSWKEFVLFLVGTDRRSKMHISLLRSKAAWSVKVAACSEPQDFIALFRESGFPGKEWMSASWMGENQQRLYASILESKRWKSWQDFVLFVTSETLGKWKTQLIQCQLPHEFIRLFKKSAISEDNWQRSQWLKRNGFGDLYLAILQDSRWETWDEFVAFASKKESQKEKVQRCRSPLDFRTLFKEEGIKGNAWKRTQWLHKNGFSMMYLAICEDPRWNSWKEFVQFVCISYSERIEQCEQSENLLALFKEVGIQGTEWQTTSWLRSNGYSDLKRAIMRCGRWETWDDFLTFMGVEVSQSWVERVKQCLTKEDFLAIFQSEQIPEEKWKNSSWLSSNEYVGLYKAIVRDGRWKVWPEFLTFMGIEGAQVQKKRNWPEKIKRCVKPQDVLTLLTAEEFPLDQWKSSTWLFGNGHAALYRAIMRDGRWGSWDHFLACMEGQMPFEGIQSEDQARELLRKEVTRLRQTDKWITGPQGGQISREEWAEILKPEYYKKNFIVKIVADYLKAQAADKS